MARKKAEVQAVEGMTTDELIAGLTQGTQAHLVSDTAKGVMHSRLKIKTPIPHLNCIMGGGIPMGIIIEMFGDPASGKSSTAYQMLAEFQEEYPEGICIIVDTEASVDEERMKVTFRVPHIQRIIRIPAMSIEAGFDQVYKILEKKRKTPALKDKPVFILWDTIGANASQSALETGNQYSDGMMGDAKLLKHELKRMFPEIEEQPILIVLLNQVSTSKGMYPNQTKLVSSGGWGIKHDAHLRIKFAGGSTETLDGDGKTGLFVGYKNSSFDLEKSKISPLFKDLPIVIDVTKGGRLDPVRSMLEFAKEKLGYVQQIAKGSQSYSLDSGLYEQFPDIMSHFKYAEDETFTWKAFSKYVMERPKIIKVFQLAFVKKISEIYEYQRVICEPYFQTLLKEIENPEPVDQGNGKIVDLWSGNTLATYDPFTQDVEIDSLKGTYSISQRKIEPVDDGKGKVYDKTTGEILKSYNPATQEAKINVFTQEVTIEEKESSNQMPVQQEIPVPDSSEVAETSKTEEVSKAKEEIPEKTEKPKKRLPTRRASKD